MLHRGYFVTFSGYFWSLSYPGGMAALVFHHFYISQHVIILFYRMLLLSKTEWVGQTGFGLLLSMRTFTEVNIIWRDRLKVFSKCYKAINLHPDDFCVKYPVFMLLLLGSISIGINLSFHHLAAIIGHDCKTKKKGKKNFTMLWAIHHLQCIVCRSGPYNCHLLSTLIWELPVSPTVNPNELVICQSNCQP